MELNGISLPFFHLSEYLRVSAQLGSYEESISRMKLNQTGANQARVATAVAAPPLSVRKKMKLIQASLLILLTIASALSAEEVIKQFVRSEVYSIDTIPIASNQKAKWIIFKNRKYDAGPNDAAGVLKHYAKQTEEKKKHGIFVHSKTHSIPFTEEEKRWMTPHLLERYQNKEWRESENALINELVEECNKLGIQVWVNLSSNVNGNWKLLTQTEN